MLLNLQNVGYIICLFSSLALSLFIFFKSKSGTGQLFGIIIFCLFFWVLCSALTDNLSGYWEKLFWTKVCMVGPIIAAPLLYSFSYYFPNSCPLSNKKVLIYPLLTTIPLLVLVPTWLNVVNIVVLPYGVDFTPGPLYLIYLVYLAIFLTLSGIRLYSKYKKGNALAKRQILTLCVGILVMSLASAIMSLVLPYFGFVKLHYISPLSTLLILSATYFAITRHRLFGIKIVIGKAVYIILLAGITYGLFYLYYLVQEKYLAAAYRPIAIAGGFILFATFVFILFTINKRLKRTVDYFIVNRKYNPDVETQNLTAELGNSLTLDDATSHILKTVNTTIDPKRAKLTFSRTSALTNIAYAALKHNNDAILEEEITDSSDESLIKLKKNLLRNKIKAVFPITIESKPIGLLFLGAKKDESAYALEEIQYLKGLCAIFAVAVDRIQLHEKSKQIATLKAARKREQEIIDVMGHELRSPATVAKMAIENLINENKSNKLTKQELAENLEYALSGINQQYSLAERYLSAAKLSKGAFMIKPVPIDIIAIAKKVLNQFDMAASSKSITLRLFTPEKLPTIEADPEAIRQVLSNLIDNAIKYSSKGTVFIKLAVVKNKVQVEAVDTGQGISKGELRNLGKRFYRTEKDRASSTPGSGLGLYVAFNIVKAHDSKIQVTSEEGKGTTFSFNLPFR